MTYTVKYRPIKGFIWKTLKDVRGDMIAPDLPGKRIFILEDETRIEVPLDGMEFRFCPRRFLSIKSAMEKESGQPISVNK